MKKLQYATVATEAHSVVVSTWQEPAGKGSRRYVDHYRMTVDGRVLDEGTLDDERGES